jgi:hypothetical protein
LIKNLEDKKLIDLTEAKSLKMNNTIAPKIYGLPKLHKEGMPLRPIVSCINSPGYFLSKFLNNILQKLRPSFKFNVRNSYEVVNRVLDIVIPSNYIIVSLDVKSLFTNIPQELIVKLIDDNWVQICDETVLDKETFIELVRYCFESTYFQYKGHFYQQVSGTPMGDPLSPILADLVMNFIATEVISKISFELQFLFIYVDDTLTAIPSDSVDLVLGIFNSINPSLQFTIELETDKCIPFLDILMIRQGVHVIMDTYQKPSSSDRLIHYRSEHPMGQKINLIKQSVNRMKTLSDKKFWEKNLNQIKRRFLLNGYPKKLINKFCNFQTVANTINQNVSTRINVPYFRIPFIKGLSSSLARVFNNFDQFRICQYNTKTVSLLHTKLKDKTEIGDCSDVVYKIPCNNCGSCYVGQTKQNLRKRIANHKNDCLPGKIHKTEKTALSAHHFDTGHNFKFSQVSILDRESNLSKRLFLEMVHINREKDTINLKSDIDNLSRVYHSILGSCSGS